ANGEKTRIMNCTISENSATAGGGMYISGSAPFLINTLYSGNNASTGGGLYTTSAPVITNCIFSGNNAPTGGGIRTNNGGAAVVSNCMLWGNSSEIANAGTGTVTVSHSVIQGGYTGTGNLNADPLFVNAPSYTTAPFMGGDYHVYPCSPAINRGDNTAIPTGVTTDLDGNNRIFNTTVDMGAYEYQHLPPASITGTETATICTGQTYLFNGLLYNANNTTATDTFRAVSGCDSI